MVTIDPPSAPPSPQRPALARLLWLRAALVLCAVTLVLPFATLLAVHLIDWNRARPWINEQVSAASGRHFEIKGNLEAHWIWPQPLDTGWRHWVPGLLVQARDLELANRKHFGDLGSLDAPSTRSQPPSLAPPARKDGAADTQPLMAQVKQASASLRLLPLLGRVVLIDTLMLSAPDIALARKKNGENNWTFPRQTQEADTAQPNPWRVDVRQLGLTQARLSYTDQMQQLALRAAIEEQDKTASTDEDSARYGLRVEMSGKFRNAKLKGWGRVGQLLSLRDAAVEYPVDFEVRAGNTRAQARGTVSNPRKLSGVDLQVQLEGDSMADLYGLTGLVLPNTPPYKTSGHLVGSLEPEHATWDYEDFSGTVGESDLEGHLTYTSGQPRPHLRGQLKSKKLRLADLGPIIGTTQSTESDKKETARPGKVLPNTKFATDRWGAMDLDIAFLGEKLLGPSSLPLDNLSMRATLKNGTLHLNPLRFGVAKGRIDTQVDLDGHTDPLNARIHATVDGLKLSALFPKVALMDKSLGRMDGAFALASRGDSIASMLASSSGEARLYVRDGTLSKQLLDLAALNLGSVIVTKLFGADKEVKLRCAMADFGIKNGMAQTRSVKLSTNEAVVEAVGTVDFGHEYINLRVKPESLQWKFFSLRTPLTVRGPFIDPKVGFEVGPLLARAGAAIVAAVAAPTALALVPITVPAAEDDAECAQLLARADEAVKVGPEGAKPKPITHAHKYSDHR